MSGGLVRPRPRGFGVVGAATGLLLLSMAPAAAGPGSECTAALSVYQQEALLSPDSLIARWDPFIREASKRFGVPVAWIRAVMTVESGGRTMLAEGAPITSGPGAMGLMQLMPASWQEMRSAYGLGNDPYDPHDNILAGAAMLRVLYAQYGYPGLFAAYNDGAGMVEARRQAGQLLPDETVAYVLEIAHILRTGHRSSHDGSVAPKVIDRGPAPDDAGDTEVPRPIDFGDDEDAAEN